MWKPLHGIVRLLFLLCFDTSDFLVVKCSGTESSVTIYIRFLYYQCQNCVIYRGGGVSDLLWVGDPRLKFGASSRARAQGNPLNWYLYYHTSSIKTF